MASIKILIKIKHNVIISVINTNNPIRNVSAFRIL